MGYKHDQNFNSDTLLTREVERVAGQPTLPHGPKPPLPPRTTLDSLSDQPLDSPPPYDEAPPIYHSQPLTSSWTAQDPRSSSTQSLVPHDASYCIDGDGNRANGKRTLLLVYIHGFMGNETSFQSFPAHVHNLVTVKLEESHVVHTKIYPRYKSRRAIEFARDAFSEWLEPHEGPDTDVMLLGHSMGGLLSAEVALLEGRRILGTINFDTPFLGMHPGVIASGLGSLFRPVPDSPTPTSGQNVAGTQGGSQTSTNEGVQSSASSSYFRSDATESTMIPTQSSSTTITPISTALDLPTKDPNFDPPFVNDVRLPQRSAWSNAWHFLNKHSDDLRKATQSYVKSHLEFGGAMADYKGLKNRYQKIRALEDIQSARRIRFVNYYTASTGRPKKPKEPSPCSSQTQNGRMDEDPRPMALETHEGSSDTLEGHSPEQSLRIPITEQHEEEVVGEDGPSCDKALSNAKESIANLEGAIPDANQAMNQLHPAPVIDGEGEEDIDDQNKPVSLEHSESNVISDTGLSKSPSAASEKVPPSRPAPVLPPVPTAPEEPASFDPNLFPDKDTRKLAEKEHSRQVKAYKQAVKDRDKTIADRRKLIVKREKDAAKAMENLEKAEEKARIKAEQRGMKKGERERAKAEREEQKKSEKERLQAEKYRAKMERDKLKNAPSPKSTSIADADADGADAEPTEGQKKRDKKFCMLPSKENGQIDPCWVRVFMPGVDEVGAHCGLFFVDGGRYEWFVEDVAERIKVWVEERGREGGS